MKKFVVTVESEWNGHISTKLIPTFAKTKRQAIKQTAKDTFSNTRILFCEALSPQMEAMIIQNYYDAVKERTDLYFNENYPIGGYYESKLYLADERLFAISNFARKVIPNGNFNN